MIDPERVLQPLAAARAAIDMLDSYATPEQLAGAVEETQRAVDRALRLFLRADANAPDELRLAALAPETQLDEVIVGLRQRALITLELAGAVHALGQSAERVRAGSVQARDGDVARHAVERVGFEVRAASEQPVRVVANEAATKLTEGAHEVARPTDSRIGRGMVLGMLAVAVLAVAVAWMLTRSDPLEDGIAAFREGRLGVAEQTLEALVDGDSTQVTALLYLGRIQRSQGRYEEARRVLSAAARSAPEDAHVQRELGYLFLDLGTPRYAIDRFRRAQELDPEAVAGWVGLVRALRAANDPSADEVLARAPPEARALMTRP